MQTKKLKTIAAGKVAGMLKKNLIHKANTASCVVWYEPKAPTDLEKYQKGRRV